MGIPPIIRCNKVKNIYFNIFCYHYSLCIFKPRHSKLHGKKQIKTFNVFEPKLITSEFSVVLFLILRNRRCLYLPKFNHLKIHMRVLMILG